MYDESFEKINNPMNDWNKATTQVCHRLAQEHLEYMGDTINRFSSNLNRLTQIKKPEDALNIQKNYLNENLMSAFEHIQKIFQISLSNAEEVSSLWQLKKNHPTKAEKSEK